MSYKRWLFLAVFLFGIGLIWGLVTPMDMPGLLTEDIGALDELADFLSPFPQIVVFIFIFLKNVTAVLLSFILSPIFCLVPVLALVVNGGVLGLISTTIVQQESVGYLLAGLLPHGVIELPAFFMGEAVALSFGASVTLAMFKKEKRELVLPSLKRNLRYLVVALILLLPAAIIETYVTPLLL